MELMFGILPPPQVEIPPSARVICSSVLHDVDWSRVSAASAFVVVVVQCRASASPLHCRIRDALEPELVLLCAGAIFKLARRQTQSYPALGAWFHASHVLPALGRSKCADRALRSAALKL